MRVKRTPVPKRDIEKHNNKRRGPVRKYILSPEDLEKYKKSEKLFKTPGNG